MTEYDFLFCSVNTDKHAIFNLLMREGFLTVDLELPSYNTLEFMLAVGCFDMLLLNGSSQCVSKDPQMSSHSEKKLCIMVS